MKRVITKTSESPSNGFIASVPGIRNNHLLLVLLQFLKHLGFLGSLTVQVKVMEQFYCRYMKVCEMHKLLEEISACFCFLSTQRLCWAVVLPLSSPGSYLSTCEQMCSQELSAWTRSSNMPCLKDRLG